MRYGHELIKGAMLASAAGQGCTGADLEAALGGLCKQAGWLETLLGLGGSAANLGVGGLVLGGAGLGLGGYSVYKGVKDSDEQITVLEEQRRRYDEADKRLQRVIAARKIGQNL